MKSWQTVILHILFNSLKTYTYENVPFNGTPSTCKYIKKSVNINIYYAIIVSTVITLYVLLIVNVNRNKLNVNGSKYKCTCTIVIFKRVNNNNWR